MLTVIAIIGILAAILLPTLNVIRNQARIKQAQADIKNLGLALESYAQDFSAYPPDTNAGLDPAFADMDNPNECMVWFLTRQFGRAAFSGSPTYPTAASADPWSLAPKDALQINARVEQPCGPFHEIKAKQRRDYDADNFAEYVDPWGRPYMYRAYMSAPRNVTDVNNTSVGGPPAIYRLTLDLDLGASPPPQGMAGVTGRIVLSGFSAATLNGTFDFEGVGADQVNILFSSSPPSHGGANRKYRFALHNPKGCDLYSLGPNGRTRGARRPDAGEWKPFLGATELARWTEVWGNPGDGNDVEKDGNVGIANQRDQDDINNW